MAVLAILEDDLPRREAMQALLPADVEVAWFDRARPMIEWLRERLHSCVLVSLDHDLIALSGEDPGSGMDVAEFLATPSPCAIVLVHTSNPLAAPGMMCLLEHAGWSVERVVAFSDLEWVERTWAPAVHRAVEQGRTQPG